MVLGFLVSAWRIMLSCTYREVYGFTSAVHRKNSGGFGRSFCWPD
jgi:hypothetical protein